MYNFLNFRGKQNAVPKWEENSESERKSYDGPAGMQPDGEIEVAEKKDLL